MCHRAGRYQKAVHLTANHIMFSLASIKQRQKVGLREQMHNFFFLHFFGLTNSIATVHCITGGYMQNLVVISVVFLTC